MLAVVLAAGRGQRLRPLTDTRSKAMLPVVGVPMIGRVLAMLEHGGATSFIVVAHPGDDPLKEYIARSDWALRVRLAHQMERRGMAHALACAAPLIYASGESDFILAACDNLYPEGHVARLIQYHCQHRLDATLTLMRVSPAEVPTLAVVAREGERITGIVEKPSPAEAPSDLGVPALYVLSVRCLEYLSRVPCSPRGEFEFPDVLRLMIENGGEVSGVEVGGRITLTQPADLVALNREFLRREEHLRVPPEVEGQVSVIPPVYIERGVTIGEGCTIGPEVYLEAGCSVGECSVLRRCVVLRGASIAPHTVLEDIAVG